MDRFCPAKTRDGLNAEISSSCPKFEHFSQTSHATLKWRKDTRVADDNDRRRAPQDLRGCGEPYSQVGSKSIPLVFSIEQRRVGFEDDGDGDGQQVAPNNDDGSNSRVAATPATGRAEKTGARLAKTCR